eukprot:m.327528 g.327528  ORF g.327528 m.327528 type:complete len:1114 (-) comp19748_c3_seq14:114-3455(-)
MFAVAAKRDLLSLFAVRSSLSCVAVLLAMPSCIYAGYLCRCAAEDHKGSQRCCAGRSRQMWEENVGPERANKCVFPPPNSLAGHTFVLTSTVTQQTKQQRRRLLEQARVNDIPSFLATEHKTIRNKVSSRPTFVKKVMICGCHFSADDVTTEGAQKRSVYTLRPDARVRSAAQLGAVPSTRQSPLSRSVSVRPATKRLRAERDAALDVCKELQEQISKDQKQKKRKAMQQQQERTQATNVPEVRRVIFAPGGQLEERGELEQQSQARVAGLTKAIDYQRALQEIEQKLLAQELELQVTRRQLKDQLEKATVQGCAKRFAHLRRELERLNGELTYVAVMDVLQATDNMDEYARLQALDLSATRAEELPTLEFSVGANSTPRTQKAQRLFSTMCMNILAGGRRSDTRSALTTASLDVFSRLGVAASSRTHRRLQKNAAENYSDLLTDHMLREMGLFSVDDINILTCISFHMGWDDDFSRGWHIHQWLDRALADLWHALTVSASVVPNPKVLMPRATDFPHHNPDIISVDKVMKAIYKDPVFAETFFGRAKAAGLTLVPGTTFCAETLREKAANLEYAQGADQDIRRRCKNAQLLDILDQPFTSYGDMTRALMILFKQPVIRKLLQEGFLWLTTGDYPKQALQRVLLRQVHHEVSEGNHFGKLCRKADPAGFEQLKDNMHLNDIDTENYIAKLSKNIIQISGPLHYKINAVKDCVEMWREPFFNRMHVLLSGQPLSAHPHARAMSISCDAVFVAWCALRDSVLELLEPLKHRFDVSAFLTFLDESISMAVLNYDVIFKTNKHELYLDFLKHYAVFCSLRKRKNYDEATLYKIDQAVYLSDHEHLAKFFTTHLNLVDEAFGEGGVNAKLRKLISDTQHMTTENIIKHMKAAYGIDMDETSANLAASFEHEYFKAKTYTTRDLEQMAGAAAVLILDIAQSLLHAKGEDLPRRLKSQSDKHDKWVCRALFHRKPSDFVFLSDKHGPPGYALHPQAGTSTNFFAPDSTGKGGCCGVSGNINGLHAALVRCQQPRHVIFPCAHAFCMACLKSPSLKVGHCDGHRFDCPYCAVAVRSVAQQCSHTRTSSPANKLAAAAGKQKTATANMISWVLANHGKEGTL